MNKIFYVSYEYSAQCASYFYVYRGMLHTAPPSCSLLNFAASEFLYLIQFIEPSSSLFTYNTSRIINSENSVFKSQIEYKAVCFQITNAEVICDGPFESPTMYWIMLIHKVQKACVSVPLINHNQLVLLNNINYSTS